MTTPGQYTEYYDWYCIVFNNNLGMIHLFMVKLYRKEIHGLSQGQKEKRKKDNLKSSYEKNKQKYRY